MLKKIILCGLLTAVACFAGEKEEVKKGNALYKNLVAGEKISKYPEYFKKSEKIDCKELGVVTGDIAKCYIVSENESLGTEKGFLMAIAAIDNKVSSVHLIKFDQASSLTPNFWSVLFKSNFKPYATFEQTQGLPAEATFKNSQDFIAEKIILEQKTILNKKSFVMDTVFLDTPIDFGGKMNFIETLMNDPRKIVRMAEVVEVFDNETQLWLYRIDFTNPIYQAMLQEDYKKKNKISEGGI